MRRPALKNGRQKDQGRDAVAQLARETAAQGMAAQGTAVQTIEAYVGDAMDNAAMGSIHWRVLALVAAGYFCDVLDFTIFGALVPDLKASGFVTQSQVPWIGSTTLLGL